MADATKTRPYRIVTRDGVKKCSGCQQIKPADAFAARSDRAGGRQSRCKACGTAYAKANRSKAVKRSARWRSANPTKALLASQTYREGNREKERQRCRRYKRENLDKNRAKCALRRARKKQAGSSYTVADVLALGEIQKHRCAHCAREWTVAVARGFHDVFHGWRGLHQDRREGIRDPHCRHARRWSHRGLWPRLLLAQEPVAAAGRQHCYPLAPLAHAQIVISEQSEASKRP